MLAMRRGSESMNADPIKSDVPPGLNEPLTPEGKEWRERLRAHAADPQPKTHPSYASFCDDPEAETGFNPALLAKYIAENYEIRTDMHSDTLYFYDSEKGIYDRNGDMMLRSLINDILQRENRQHRSTETVYLVHSKTLSEINFSEKIAVENGLLDVKTRELTSFTPGEFCIVALPVRYDAAAQCPQILKFLNETLEPDQIPIIQEWFGYCLSQEYPIHISIVLLGDGANGKSTLLNLLNAFLGPENCSHVTLQQLCEGKFELAELYGKLANVCDDLPGDALKSVGNFKNLTGNAPIQAQFKHKNPFDFLNHAKLIWACNKLPAASEDTIAYYRRFIILNFNKYFIGEKADAHLIEKLTTTGELSGLLNYALEGLSRLLANQGFTNAQSIEETRSQYIRTADSCQAFLEEMTEISLNNEDFVRDDVLYSRYIAYCQFYKLPRKRKADLTISIQKHRPEAQKAMPRIGKERPRVWTYLKLKDFGTGGTAGTDLSLFSEISESKILKKRGTPVPDVPVVPVESRACGQCALFHQPGCVFPGMNFDKVPENANFAVDCRSFKVREAGA
jgi:P4 family phage/plasmid primase-like protien